MSVTNRIEWVLRIGVAGEFLGHAMFSLQGKAQWTGWIRELLGVDGATAVTLLMLIGIADVAVAAIVLLRPVRLVLLWAAVWGFWTALLRPIVGEPVWDFVERWTNWAAPLALLLLRGWPVRPRDWIT